MHTYTNTHIVGLCAGIALSLTLGACQTTSSMSTNNTSIKSTTSVVPANTMDNHTESRRVNVGDTFILELPSNPSTGYKWKLAKALDETLLKKINDGYQPKPNPQGMVGGGGTEIWAFKALTAGKAYIDMVYVRPWESEDTTGEYVRYQIDIK